MCAQVHALHIHNLLVHILCHTFPNMQRDSVSIHWHPASNQEADAGSGTGEQDMSLEDQGLLTRPGSAAKERNISRSEPGSPRASLGYRGDTGGCTQQRDTPYSSGASAGYTGARLLQRSDNQPLMPRDVRSTAQMARAPVWRALGVARCESSIKYSSCAYQEPANDLQVIGEGRGGSLERGKNVRLLAQVGCAPMLLLPITHGRL